MNLGYLLENAAARHFHRVAAFDEKRKVTFGQLNERANRLGNALIALGLQPQSRIASLQYNGIETIEFDVMAAKFGYVRALLNARNSVAEHIDSLNLVQARLLVFGAEFIQQVDEIRGAVPTLEFCICIGGSTTWAAEYEAVLSRAAAAPATHVVNENDWHSIYFTSGTTGKPKGIVLSQRNWLAVVRNHLVDTYAKSDTSDVLLHAAPMSHASGSLTFAHLARGVPQTFLKRFDAATTLDTFERDDVTTIWLAPTMWSKMVELMDGKDRNLSTLRSIRFGGAPISVPRLRDAVERWGPRFCSGWGQWEAPQQCTFFTQEQIGAAVAARDDRRLASAGVPMTYCRIATADADGTILPRGEEGEIVVTGDHVMVGYLDQPEATAELRIGEWQRTGDIGRIDEEGFLYLTDRKRDIILSGGSNIFPRQIEEVLYAHPAVLEVVAVGIPDNTWGETIHAVVVPRDGATADSAALLDWCRDRLPSNKRPRSVEFVQDLPKNTYGKILRREVRARYWTAQERQI
ncbi:MAG: AMP-dependent synthetase [Betaproteobacteria bacterium]|nr:AMP-dependent synthetase [Betaproteobacteria bacterium]